MPIFGTPLSRPAARQPLDRRGSTIARAAPLTHEGYRLAAAWLDHLWNQAPSQQKSRLMAHLLVLVDEFEARHAGA